MDILNWKCGSDVENIRIKSYIIGDNFFESNLSELHLCVCVCEKHNAY